MNIATNERGALLLSAGLIALSVLFILLMLVSFLGQNYWPGLVFFLLGALVYPLSMAVIHRLTART